jgi:hypothetical protein
MLLLVFYKYMVEDNVCPFFIINVEHHFLAGGNISQMVC